jgi:zinc protease
MTMPFVSLRAAVAATLTTFVLLAAPSANAMTIQEVRSPGGIEAWLVEDHAIPIISMRFAMAGGSSQDPAPKLGLVNMLSSLLDEGAGPLDSQAFQRRMQDLNMKMSFNATLDHFSGTFQTLTENRDDAFDMLRLALNEPRFDAGPVDRIRGQILVSIARKGQSPDDVAANAWMRLAFADHVYSRPTDGTLDTVRAIAPEDLKDMASRLFARGGLKIAVVGDVDAATLGTLLDKVFAGLPAQTQLAAVPETAVTSGPAQEIIDMNIPQSVIQFGHAGFKRKDDDFVPAYILNYILGGGGFNSRLTTEVREKRGLAYSIYSYLSPLDRAGLFLGGAATRNDRVGQSLDIIRAELERMAGEGPTVEELDNAKTYLTGSYALRFESSSKIAGQLLGIQLEDLGKDYIDRRNGLIEAVTIDDIKRVARRLLQPGQLIVTIVGRPEGLVKPKTGG